jgi:hypothetical protein
MLRALGLSIHVAHVALHVALLLIAALDDVRDRRSLLRPPTGVRPFESSGAIGWQRSSDAAPYYPAAHYSMPVWRPDPNVRYTAVVLEVDPAAADRRADAAPGVNRYAHAAAPPR